MKLISSAFPTAWRPILWALCLLAAGASIQLLLWDHGLCHWPERTVHLKKFQREQGVAFTAKYPRAWPGFAVNSHTAVLTENGLPLTKVKQEFIVRERGGGTFFSRGNRAILASSDGSDPRSNGREYVVTHQLQVQPPVRATVLILGAVSAIFGMWISRAPLIRQAAASGWFPAVGNASVIWACVLFGVALGVRIHFLNANPDRTEGFSIRGIPFSDARAWNQMAKAMAGGGGVDIGFPAKRPFFSIFLALFYQWGWESLEVAKSLQAAVGAASTALVFLVFRRFAGFWAAGAAAFYFAIDPRQIAQTGELMTEPLGTLLILVCAWLLIVAGSTRDRWPLLCAGAAFALSNLTRPLTLFGFPFFILLIGIRAFRTGRSLRAAILPMGLFFLGTALCIGPWVVRQRIVHGIWSISDNTASGLYAASTPEFGTWGGGVESRPNEAGIPATVKDRYEFFQRGFREHLRKYPGFYWRNVRESVIGAALDSEIVTPAFRQAGSLALAGVALLAWRRRAWTTLIAAGIAWLILMRIDTTAARWLAAGGLLFTLWRAPFAGAVLAATYLSALLGTALFGNPILFRTHYLMDWMEIGWICIALLQTGRLALALALRAPAQHWWETGGSSEENAAGIAIRKALRRMGWAAGVFIGISALHLFALNTFLPPTPPAEIVLEKEDRVRLASMLAERAPALKPLALRAGEANTATDVARPFINVVWLNRDAYSFPANLDIQSSVEIFRPQAEDFCIVEMFAARHPQRTRPSLGFFSGDFPNDWLGRRCIVVGLSRVRNRGVRSGFFAVELLALLPGTEITPDAVRQALLGAITPEKQALLDELAKPQEPVQ